MSIPVIDIGEVNLSVLDDKLSADHVAKVGDSIYHAFCDVGILFIRNHGIDERLLETVYREMKDFFKLPLEVKNKYLRHWEDNETSGFTAQDGPEHIGTIEDVKQAFNFKPFMRESLWPIAEIPSFKDNYCNVFKQFTLLFHRMLFLLAKAMHREDDMEFVKGCNKVGTADNITQMRLNHYPALQGDKKPLPGQCRLSEHSDFGMLTFLYEPEAVPGLQVWNRANEIVDVEFDRELLLVNVADLFQMWTDDEVHSARHRVVFHPDTIAKERNSIVYFGIPDDDFVVRAKNYPPIRTSDYMDQRFKDTTYGKGLSSVIKY